MPRITKRILDKYKTENGAYTKGQIEALGLKWPPEKGWKKKLISQGIFIKVEAFKRFQNNKPKNWLSKKQFDVKKKACREFNQFLRTSEAKDKMNAFLKENK